MNVRLGLASHVLSVLLTGLSLVVAGTVVRPSEIPLYREDFNRYAPDAQLIKQVGWSSSGETDDVSLSGGGQAGAQDLFLDGSTNVPVEQGASSVPYYSKELDR